MASTRTETDAPTIRVFCDFDGTITLRDLGNEVIKEFGDFALHKQLLNGTVTIREYWKMAFGSCTALTKERIHAFAQEQLVDAHFKRFAEFLHSHRVPLYVVSDGFREYVQPILLQQNIDAPTYCNYLSFETNSSAPSPRFPGACENCTCTFAASCKRNVVLKHTADDDVVVYIGDGRSDFCGAEHADIVFAKKQLAAYCNKHRIPHYPFKSFFDIKTTFEKLLTTGKIKQRYQAALARKKAFESE